MSRTYRNNESNGRRITGIPAVKPAATDLAISNQGSLFLITPRNDIARAWLRDSVPDDAQWLGAALAVEPRYVGELVEGALCVGLVVS